MKKILFVDDEDNILQGLRRMLRPMRKEWDMQFALGGEAAIKLLEDETFNAVVTDMRMPFVDGSKVLDFIKSHDPSVARIVLSGQTDQEGTIKLTGTAHQFLSKPCNTEELKCTVQRAFDLRELVQNKGIQTIVSSINSLPSLPELYLKLTEEMNADPDNFSIEKVGDLVSKDVSMSAKVLQLSNSSFFGLVSHVKSVHQAVQFLGSDIIRALCIGDAVFKTFSSKDDVGTLETLWQHSINVSTVATAICKSEHADANISDQANQAGILHAIGTLILMTSMKEKFEEITNLMTEEGISQHDAEERIISCNHAQIGGYLMCLWGLPDSIVEAITFHLEPQKCQMMENEFSPLIAVHAANALVCHCNGEEDALEKRLNTEWLEKVGFAQKVDSWLTITNKLVKEKED